MEMKLNVTDVNKNLQHFDWVDYVVFIFMLISCAAVGVYFGFVEKNRRRNYAAPNATEVAQEYLMGGKQMTVVPVAMSLVASWISGISLLGLVTEMYLYGTQYFFVICALILSGILTSYVYLPVFHDLQLESCCEYLEKRFDKRMRLFGSILFTLHTLTFLPVVIYVPALAFNQVTGVNIHIVTPFVCAICIFYTLVGGIKAVVWTDCIQTFIMIGTMLVIVAKGAVDAYGLSNVWDKSWAGGRIVFPELTLDPKIRHSVLALLVGGTTYFTYTFTMTQSMIQRYLALPTLRSAKYALSLYVFTISSLITICCLAGLIVYTLYSQCDPLKTKLISAPDQLLPLLVMDSLGKYPGMPGLFVAGIFSAALSSLSTCVNAMAAVVLEDFYKPFIQRSLTETQTSYLMRGVVFLVGIASTGLVFIVEKLGTTILQLQMSIAGVTAAAGPVFGVFKMGMLMPWVKRKEAFYGGVCGLIAMSWILYKAQTDIVSGALTFPKKALYTDSCDYNFELDSFSNQTQSMNEDDGTFKIHHVSYLFYTFIGAVFTIVCGTIASLVLDVGNVSDPRLFSPVIRKFISTPQSLLNVRQNNSDKDCIVHAFDVQDYIPCIIYVPALAFNQVTEVNIHIVTPVVCVVCIFYTMVGGIKAVVWTDCIQTVAMIGSLILVTVKSTMDLNGLDTVWMRNLEGERLNFPELTFDVTVRYSVLSLLLGGVPFFITTNIMGQSTAQRHLSLPTLKEANYALVIFTILICSLFGICCYSGMLAYAFYSGCDPLKTKLIVSQDQILPLLVMNILGRFPGLPGLFVAGIFSASLSTLSTILNAMAAIVLEDFYKPFANQPLTEKQTGYLLKGVVLGVGILSFTLVFIVEKLGKVLPLSMSVGDVTCGPTFGIFTMGLMLPWVNKRGAFTGGIVALLTMIWILVNAQLDIALTFSKKPLHTDDCAYNFTSDVLINSTLAHNDTDSSFKVHHFSSLFYTILGGLIAIGVGLCVSLLCEEKLECDMDPQLFSPFVRKFINSKKLLSIRPDVRENSCVIHAFETRDTQF